MKAATARRRAKAATAKPAAIVRVNPAPEQPWLLSEAEVTLIKNNVAKGASDQELSFLLTVARRYKLDPFKQQIWFVQRWDSNADTGHGGKGAKVWTPQVAVNGLLFAAARDHREDFGSVSAPTFGPMIKFDTVTAPEWASIMVFKKGAEQPTEAVAYWTEYAPSDLSKAPFWRKMPRRMLAKCATALAIRQAYPDLGGLYIPEECERMNEDHTPEGRQIIPQTSTAEQEKQKIVKAKLVAHETGKVIEVQPEEIPKMEKLTVIPWKEGRVELLGTEALAIIKSELSPEELTELGIVRNVPEKVTHMPAANVFSLIDRAKKCNVEAILEDPGVGH